MKRTKILKAAVLLACLAACGFFIKQIFFKTENKISDGIYSCYVNLEGGSGKATVNSPANVTIESGDKKVELVWSSPNYDYMIVDDNRYDNEAAVGENSVFTIPFENFDEPFKVIGDTTAMSTPHEIEYTITVISPEVNHIVDAITTNSGVEDAGEVTLGDLEYVSSMPLDYAKEFSVSYYEDEAGDKYTLITIGKEGSRQYFMISESGKKPSGVSDNVTLLENLDKTYLVSTSVMDLMASIDGLDNIRFSGTDEGDWYIKAAKEKMSSGDILYAGKYSAPDYELLISEKCNFAIENTMIYHNPEVKEKLESLGIPVMVERSSYETNPLGRLEWIKLYGLLYGKEDEANTAFEEQKSRAKAISDVESTGLKVAVFSIDSNGMISIRKPGDYITSMIEMAGGNYVPANISVSEDNALSTMKITMEDFYVEAVDADVLIYNSTIEGEIKSIDELIKKSEVLKDFKAVKSGNVYCLSKGYFQQSSDVAEFIEDVHIILTGESGSLQHLFKLKE